MQKGSFFCDTKAVNPRLADQRLDLVGREVEASSRPAEARMASCGDLSMIVQVTGSADTYRIQCMNACMNTYSSWKWRHQSVLDCLWLMDGFMVFDGSLTELFIDWERSLVVKIRKRSNGG